MERLAGTVPAPSRRPSQLVFTKFHGQVTFYFGTLHRKLLQEMVTEGCGIWRPLYSVQLARLHQGELVMHWSVRTEY